MSEWKTMGEEGAFAQALATARTCIRCGTEWRMDCATAKLNGTDHGPVCASRSNCDHRGKVRESLAGLRAVRESEYRPAP